MKTIIPILMGGIAWAIVWFLFDATAAEGYLAYLLGYMQGDNWAREGEN